MKSNFIFCTLVLGCLLLFSSVGVAQSSLPNSALPSVKERNVRAHMEFLASDVLQGRGSGTRDELISGRYIAAQLRQFGIEPAGEAGDYIQTINLGAKQTFATPPKLIVGNKEWSHGKDIIIWRISSGTIQGPLQKMPSDGTPIKGAVVFTSFPETLTQRELSQRVFAITRQGAAAVVVAENAQVKQNREVLAATMPTFTTPSNEFREGAGGPPINLNIVFLAPEVTQSLTQTADGTLITIGGTLGPPEIRLTYNALGVLPGSQPNGDAVILSAHLDHLGVRPNVPGEDKIFNGADDDASGCVAVLELARALGSGQQPKRDVYFVFFGSEEAGGFGARYFLKHPPTPIQKMAANLEFEMIGRPDNKVKPDELWLTGYDRSNLGPELAKQGAKLVPDPHPEEQFFMRSDNYALARMGVVAHTVSSFGLHKEYHQPNDDSAHIDFKHMTNAINSMVGPVAWLVNSSFTPIWVEGKKP